MRKLPPRAARVSIIVPFYNAENHLERCVQSLVGQSYADIEMIFVNDGSTDASREIVAGYQQKDARITIIDIENSGAGIARKTGLAKATGTYLMFCDSDDYYEPDMVATMVALMEERDDIDLAVCSCNVIEAFSSNKRENKEYFYTHRNGIYDLTEYMKQQVNVVLWNKILRMDFIRKHSIDFIDLRMAEDLDFIYKYLAVAHKINFTSSPLYNHVFWDNSLSEELFFSSTHIDANLTCFENILNFMKQRDVVQNNQQYFSHTLPYEDYLIHNKYLEDQNENGRPEFAARLYRLAREIDVEYIRDEYLKWLIKRMAAGNLPALEPEDVLRGDYDEGVIPLVFAVDNSYAPYLATALQSVIANASAGGDYLVIIS